MDKMIKESPPDVSVVSSTRMNLMKFTILRSNFKRFYKFNSSLYPVKLYFIIY